MIQWIIAIALICCYFVFYIAGHQESEDICAAPKHEGAVFRSLLSDDRSIAKPDTEGIQNNDEQLTDEMRRSSLKSEWIELYNEVLRWKKEIDLAADSWDWDQARALRQKLNQMDFEQKLRKLGEETNKMTMRLEPVQEDFLRSVSMSKSDTGGIQNNGEQFSDEMRRSSLITEWIYWHKEVDGCMEVQAKLVGELADLQQFEHIWQKLNQMLPRLRQLDQEIDEITMKLEPVQDGLSRSVSMLPRSQGKERTCWMFAAATLLRTRESVLTPHSDLVRELQDIETEFKEFVEQFQRLYEANNVDGIKYWIESNWWELTQTPFMQQIWWYSWADIYGDGKDPLLGAHSQQLMRERFFSLHGFQLADLIDLRKRNGQIYWHSFGTTHESALIGYGPSEWKKIEEQYMNLKSAVGDGGHGLVLERFDEESGSYILKNSWGPTGVTPGKKEGKIHIPREAFPSLGGRIYPIVQRTTVRGTGWLWAAAVFLQQQREVDMPLEDIVREINLRWHKGSKLARKFDNELDVVEWGTDDEYSRKKARQTRYKIEAVDGFSWKKGLEFAAKLTFADTLSTMKPFLKQSTTQGALVLLNDVAWRRMSEFTNFHALNGIESNPGPPQLMFLVGYDEEDGNFVLQDTHGLNGKAPGPQGEQHFIRIPADVKLEFDIWFLENESPE